MKSNLGRLGRTVSDTLSDAQKKLDRTWQKPEVQSAMLGVERRLERTGETLERAAGWGASAFYKASAKMMENAERTLTSLRNDPGTSPAASPTSATSAPAGAVASAASSAVPSASSRGKDEQPK